MYTYHHATPLSNMLTTHINHACAFFMIRWCVFELYTANDKNCEVIIAMPPHDKLQMVDALRRKNGFHKMFQAMAGEFLIDFQT